MLFVRLALVFASLVLFVVVLKLVMVLALIAAVAVFGVVAIRYVRVFLASALGARPRPVFRSRNAASASSTRARPAKRLRRT